MSSLNLDAYRRIILPNALALAALASVISVDTTEAKESCLAPPSPMIHWWPGDGNALDLVGTADGFTRNGADYGVGLVNESFQTDGIDDYIDVGSPGDMNFGNAFDYSIDAWVNPEDFIPVADSGSSIIIEKHQFGGGGAIPVFATINPSGTVSVLVRDTQDDSVSIQSSQPIAIGEWTHVAMTVDRDGVMSLYINGVLDGT